MPPKVTPTNLANLFTQCTARPRPRVCVRLHAAARPVRHFVTTCASHSAISSNETHAPSASAAATSTSTTYTSPLRTFTLPGVPSSTTNSSSSSRGSGDSSETTSSVTTSSPPTIPLPTRAQQPSYHLRFTCTPCGATSAHTISRHGYHHGSVLVTCPTCRNRHVIADHLGVFGERRGVTVEDFVRERTGGKGFVKRGALGEDGDVEWYDARDADRVEGEAEGEGEGKGRALTDAGRGAADEIPDEDGRPTTFADRANPTPAPHGRPREMLLRRHKTDEEARQAQRDEWRAMEKGVSRVVDDIQRKWPVARRAGRASANSRAGDV